MKNNLFNCLESTVRFDSTTVAAAPLAQSRWRYAGLVSNSTSFSQVNQPIRDNKVSKNKVFLNPQGSCIFIGINMYKIL